jgi:hypothetical protein
VLGRPCLDGRCAIIIFKFLLSLQELFSARNGQVGRGRRSPRLRRHSLRMVPEKLESRRLMSLTATDGGLLVNDPDFVDVYGVKGATWLANANLAATNTFGVAGINLDGSMTWQTALNWVAAMNKFDNGPKRPQGYLGHNNWTLPLTPDKDPNGTIVNPTYHATFGFNCDAGAMGHLFYDEFGGVAGESISEIQNANTALFNNFQPYLYWGGHWKPSKRPLPVSFTFDSGFLGTTNSNDFLYAIPEFPSEIADVPQRAPTNNVIPLHTTMAAGSLVASADGSLVFDSQLKINWLAKANLAETNTFGLPMGFNSSSTAISINPDGSMNYPTAVAWINAMNAADYLSHDNWRLPDTSDDPHGKQAGYYHDKSEMGELYYNEFGAQAGATVLSAPNAATGLFQNFQPDLYWSETSNASASANNGHKTFSFGNGYQGGNFDADQWYVIPVFDNKPLMVTNNQDNGPGSLRAVVAAAKPGQTIAFASNLAGGTINLLSAIDITLPLDIAGPITGKLAISGQNAVGLFDIAPTAAGTTLAHLTLEKGQSIEGGAILDDGAALVLDSDSLRNDRAVSNLPGMNADGGALAVLGDASSNMAVALANCHFNSDSANGGPAISGQGGAIYLDAGTSSNFSFSVSQNTVFTGDSAGGSHGQNAEGGALFLNADQATRPSFSFSDDTFSKCSATGQSGNNSTNGNGQDGGAADGGAIYYDDNSALSPNLSIVQSTFISNTCTGGSGGAGRTASIPSGGTGGNGGAGGPGAGGALFVNFQNSTKSIVTITADNLSKNVVLGGKGGAGSFGASIGGNGARGGTTEGGAIDVQIDGSPISTNLTIANSEMDDNTATGANGGAAGGGAAGGIGGDGGGALGAALLVNSQGATLTDLWTLNTLTISGNTAESGAGGKGGVGRHAGNGGNSPASAGGGIADYFSGTLDILTCSISKNSVKNNVGGAAGAGVVPGAKGSSVGGFGGGLYIDPSATADASPVLTTIKDNFAEFSPNVSGILGST